MSQERPPTRHGRNNKKRAASSCIINSDGAIECDRTFQFDDVKDSLGHTAHFPTKNKSNKKTRLSPEEEPLARARNLQESFHNRRQEQRDNFRQTVTGSTAYLGKIPRRPTVNDKPSIELKIPKLKVQKSLQTIDLASSDSDTVIAEEELPWSTPEQAKKTPSKLPNSTSLVKDVVNYCESQNFMQQPSPKQQFGLCGNVETTEKQDTKKKETEPFKLTRRATEKARPIVPGSSLTKLSIIDKMRATRNSIFHNDDRKVASTQKLPVPKNGVEPIQLNPNRQRRSSRISTKTTPETIVLDTDDEKGASRREAIRTPPYDAVRIALGKKVERGECKLDFKDSSIELSFAVSASRLTRPSSNRKNHPTRKQHVIHFEDVQEMKYHLREETHGDEEKKENSDEDDTQGSFLALRVSPNKENGLDVLTRSYLPNADDFGKKYILVEFRYDNEFRQLIDRFKKDKNFSVYFGGDANRLKDNEAQGYAISLVDDSKNDRTIRLRSMGSPSSHRKRSDLLKGLEDDDIILITPNAIDPEEIEACADGLIEAKGPAMPLRSDQPESTEKDCSEGDSDEKEDSKDEPKSKLRGHQITLRVSDLERLEPGEFLNDNLIDFWMSWISRHDTSNVHLFSSHFYSRLVDEGVDRVKSWTEKKGLDVFAKKMIFIPVNKSLHWSVAVVVNPGAIIRHIDVLNQDFDVYNEVDEYPFILFLDSLKAHQKKTIAKHVRGWLNSEWARLDKSKDDKPFTEQSLQVHSPRIPYQDNSCDCGVFICRYAYAMYLLRHKSFSYGECDVPYNRKKKALEQIISQSPEFDFSVDDIARLRQEMKQLIERMAKLYLKLSRQKKAENDAALLDKAGTEDVGSLSVQQESFSQNTKDSSVEVISDNSAVLKEAKMANETENEHLTANV